jgi:hypothetical protein
LNEMIYSLFIIHISKVNVSFLRLFSAAPDIYSDPSLVVGLGWYLLHSMIHSMIHSVACPMMDLNDRFPSNHV